MSTFNSVLQYLLTQPQKFDFFHAVRLIKQAIQYTTEQNSQASALTSGNIYFRTTPSLKFPESPINSVKLLYPENSVNFEFELHIALLGLTGACGLLPYHYTELMLERLQNKDNVLLDFLDIFNHSMASLFYQAWEKNRFYIGYEQNNFKGNTSDRFTHMLHCLTGNGMQQIASRNLLPKEIKLFYMMHFSNQHRPACSLQNMLSDYFSIPVEVKPFQNKCFLLPNKECTRLTIGINHYNQIGVNAVLGNRVWNCQYHFRVVLGPLNYTQFKQFLPNAIKSQMLVMFIREYVGSSLTFDVNLVLIPQHIPDCRLGTEITLGQNAWL